MSKMAELSYDIEQLFIEGKNAGQIARELNCPVSVVYDWMAAESLEDVDTDEDVGSDVFANMVKQLA